MAVLFLLPFYFLYYESTSKTGTSELLSKFSTSTEKNLSNEQFHFCQAEVSLTQFRMGRGWKKTPTASFSPVTFKNLGIGPQNFLASRFNHFAIPSASPKLLNLNWGAPKNICFSSQIVTKLMLG